MRSHLIQQRYHWCISTMESSLCLLLLSCYNERKQKTLKRKKKLTCYYIQIKQDSLSSSSFFAAAMTLLLFTLNINSLCVMNQGLIVLLCCLHDCSFDSLQPLRCVWCAVTPKDATIGPAGSKPNTQLSPCMPNGTHRGAVWQQARVFFHDEKRGCLRVMLNKDLSKSAAFQMSINKIISQRAAKSKSMLSVEFVRFLPLHIMLIVHFLLPQITLYTAVMWQTALRDRGSSYPS